MSFVDTIKNNLVAAAAIVSAIGAIGGSALYFTSTFVSAEEYKKDISAQVQAIKRLEVEGKKTALKYQLQSVDDKVFYLETNPNPSPNTPALVNRYKTQRQDLVRELESLK